MPNKLEYSFILEQINKYGYHLESEVLCRHHIDYNKQNCIPKNIITLYLSCNSVANYNRKWYKAWYQAIIFRRYRYNNRSK
jgi:hypothetical protein